MNEQIRGTLRLPTVSSRARLNAHASGTPSGEALSCFSRHAIYLLGEKEINGEQFDGHAADHSNLKNYFYPSHFSKAMLFVT